MVLTPGSTWMMTRHYFSVVSGIVLFLSLWGFSDNLIWDIQQPSNKNPMFVIHGLFCLAWMAAFFAQSLLVRSGNVALHRIAGVYGLAAATGVSLSTLWVFIHVWQGWDAMPYYAQANRLLLPSFSLLVLLAWLNRTRPDIHKRLMYLGTLYLLEPILSRSFDPLEPLLTNFSATEIDYYWMIFTVAVWNLLFVSLFVYDRLTSLRVHPVSIAGYVWFYVIWGMTAAL